jgi:hypothetical protein
MKKISILSGILLIACLCHGQRFFYIQDSQPTQKILTDELQHAFQYVTTTPLASDYIIKSEVGFQAETHSLTMQITLQDSITFQTIFQANESCGVGKTNLERADKYDTKLAINASFEDIIKISA